MKSKLTITVLVMAVVLAFTGVAKADWSWQWNNTLEGSDVYESFVVSGGGVWAGDTNFSDPSWSGTLVNPGYIMESGNPLVAGEYLTWDRIIASDPSVAFVEDDLVWSGGGYGKGDLLYAAQFYWNGTNWNLDKEFDLTIFDPSIFNRSEVPLPGTAWLLLSGLAGLGLVRFRKRFKA